MDTDLSQMSKPELEKLRSDVDKALSTLDQRRKSEARAAAEKAAKDFGFGLDELMVRERKAGSKSPAKFRNPEDPRQTWTGRGRQPGWIKSALADGKSLDDYAI